jgi:hypothetical protein
MFDEVFSWWSSLEVMLLDSNELDIKLQEKLEAQSRQAIVKEQKVLTVRDAVEPSSFETQGRFICS